MHELRLTHPNIDLQPGVEEVMKLWRLCHLVAITRTRTLVDGKPVLDIPPDWSFLPPLTIFATASSSRHLGDILQTIVFSSKDESADPRKDDYLSAALVTLDLLRTTPCKTGGDKIGICAESPQYQPWVRLMEALLESAPPTLLPPCIEERLIGGSEELMERYWRLLRRMGMKSTIIETEKRRIVYQRGVRKEEALSKEASDAVKVGSTSPSQSATTSEGAAITSPEPAELSTPQAQVGDQEEQPRQTPHIKFTTPPDNPMVEEFALSQITRLGRALDKSDIHQVEFIRRNIAAFASSNHLTSTAMPVEVYEHLMMVLFALKHPRSAVEVWQKFTEDGYVPTVKTYTVLMQGASHAHDVTTMEKFWNAMRHQAKLQPDSHAWSTRIKGLFLAKVTPRGLTALSEMGKEWYTAARNAEYAAAGLPLPQNGSKKAPTLPEPSLPSLLSKYPDSIDGVPRPGLVVMNTAIGALASTYNDSEIPKVLHWGRTFGVEPDLITYNSLLSICMRHSRGEEALALLGRMREKNISADSTTWTVLLTALFNAGFLDDLSHEAQGKKIMEFIRSVEDVDTSEEDETPATTAGKRKKGGLDVKGYALIIDRLLKIHFNPNSAAEVLQYMVSDANLRPTAQIYTILMTSYFFPNGQGQEGPGPDWNAIDTLWTQISTPDDKGFTPGLDPIFFDRMVEGYALHHEIVGMKPAMDFLARMSERGMKPGFGALEAVARMLAQRGEWSVMKRLVQEVRKRDPGRRGVMYQKQRGFWEFVVGTGVLAEEGIRGVEDVFRGDVGVRRGHWRDG